MEERVDWRGEEPSAPSKVLPARAIDGVGRMALMAASATFHDGSADIAYGSAQILGHLLLSETRQWGGGWGGSTWGGGPTPLMARAGNKP
jgi:hypothetical protein